jgi:hypothetical protein
MENIMNIHSNPLVDELTNAIEECERSPSLPNYVDSDDYLAFGGNERNLKNEVQSIKRNLPEFLLKASTEELSELTTTLKSCAELAKKASQLDAQSELFLRIVSEFDDQIGYTAIYVGLMEVAMMDR